MSVRSHNHRATRLAPTDPKWYPVTRGLNRWLNKMARRNDLAVRVLRGNFGAPARYVPNVAEIDFAEALLSKVDPTTVGAQDFVIKHPKIAGGAVHEAAHARWSTFDLPSIAKQYGPRHANTFALLEEGRCETQQWRDLTDSERDALSFMVLNLVLREVLDGPDAEEDDEKPEGYDPMSDPRTLVRLVGLIAGRCETGIIDKSQVKVVALLDRLRDVLGEHFDTLWDLAVTFARSRNDDHYSDNVHTRVRHEVVRQWLATVDDLLPPDETGGSGSGKDESEEGESEPGGGGGASESDDKGDESESGGSGDESSDDGDGADGNADGDDESNDDDGEPGDTTPGDDDEGVEGDGENVIDGDDDGDASLGDYGGNSVRKTIEDVFGDLAEAAEVAEKVSGSRLRSRAGDIRTAVAADHRRRRELNKEAMRRW